MNATTDMRRAAVGLSLLLFTTGFTFWGGLSMIMSAPHTTQDILLFYSVPLCLSFVAGSALAACPGVFLGSASRAPRPCRALFVALGAALEAGVVMRLVGVGGSNPGLLAMTAVLIGCGTGFQFCLWARVLFALGTRVDYKVVVAGGCAFSLAYAAYTFVDLPTDVTGYLVVTALLVALFLLYRSLEVAEPTVAAGTSAGSGAPPAAGPPCVSAGTRLSGRFAASALRGRFSLLACLACIALTASVIRCVALSDARLSGPVARWTMLAAAVAVAAFGVYLHATHGRLSYTLLYSVTFPVLATGILLLPAASVTARVVVASVTFGLFMACSLVIMLQACDEARAGGGSPSGICALLVGTLYLFMAVGTSLGALLLGLDELEFSTLLVIALALVYAVAMASSLLARFRGASGTSPQGDAHGGFIAGRPAPVDGAVLPARPDDASVGHVSGDPELAGDSLAVRCAGLAAAWSLSAREADVFALLARGRDVPYISEALSLSKNTVRTHIKGIYGKAGVHSRRELLDVLEEG